MALELLCAWGVARFLPRPGRRSWRRRTQEECKVMDQNSYMDGNGTCRAPECGRVARTARCCPRHYQQIRRHGRLTPEREYRSRGGVCSVGACDKAQIAKGLCFRHYQQIRRYGRLTPERERAYGRTGCRVSDCTERHSSRGFCKRHYMSEYYLPRRQGATAHELKRAAA